MKMLQQCRATHILWVIWNVEFDSGIHFFKLDEGQSQAKGGHISKFEI